MRVTFMRHGETNWNVARRIQGTQPVPINANGIFQIRDACSGFWGQAGFRFATIITSPLLRARQSAEICSETFQIPIEIQSDFRERSFGDLEGKTYVEVNQQFGILDIEAYDGNAQSHAFGVESVLDLDKRLMHGIEMLKAGFQDENVLVMTHGSVIKRIVDLYGMKQIGIIPNGAYVQMDL